MWKICKRRKKSELPDPILKGLENVTGEITQEEAQVWFAKYLYANPYLAIKLLTGVSIINIQDILIRTFVKKDYCLNVLGRASGKTFTISMFIPYYAIFNPKIKIVITAKNARQTRAIFRQIEKWVESKEGKHLKDCIQKMSKDHDGWRIEFKNGSEVVFLPLGSGDQIRGQRAHVLIVDEFLLMDEGVFNNVIRPFMAAKREGVEQERIKKAEDILIKAGKLKESQRTPEKNNKLIILSSASYKFEYLHTVYENYYDVLFPESEDIEPSYDHAIFKMSYEALADEPILDIKAIEEGRRTMSSQQFRREFQSHFLDDSGGYFSAQKMKYCTVPAGDHPIIQIQGDKNSKYILSLDPNYSDSETADNFAMAVLEINEEKDRLHLVHCYALSKSDIKKRGDYLNYILSNFNIVYIIADNAGGSKFFEDVKTLNLTNRAISSFDANFDDENGIRESKSRYNYETGSILHLQHFGGKKGWVREANEHLQYCIENKKIIFNATVINERDRDILMKSNIPIEKLYFQLDNDEKDYKGIAQKNFSKARLSDFIDKQGFLVSETIKECSLIEMRSSSTGSQVFDLPSNLSKDKSPNRARKDSYSALLLGCWGWHCYKKLENTQEKRGRIILSPRFIG